MKKPGILIESLMKVYEANGIDTTSLKAVACGFTKKEAFDCIEKAAAKARSDGNTVLENALSLALAAMECCCKAEDKEDCELPPEVCEKLVPFCKKGETVPEADKSSPSPVVAPGTQGPAEAAAMQQLQVLSAKTGIPAAPAKVATESKFFDLSKLNLL